MKENMLFIGVLLLVALLFRVPLTMAAETPCGTASSTTEFNKTIDTIIAKPNLCKGAKGQPFCVNTVRETEIGSKFYCRECSKNCDCPINLYCVKSVFNNGTRGTCVPIEESILNKPCNNFEMKSYGRFTVEPVYPVKGIDDEMVCGLPIFDSADNNRFLFYEWLGTCKEGVCKVCAPLGPQFQQEYDYMEEVEQSSLFCPGRECVGGVLRLSNYAIDPNDFNPLRKLQSMEGISGSILAFVIIITLANIVMCLCSIKNARSPRRYKNVSQKL